MTLDILTKRLRYADLAAKYEATGVFVARRKRLGVRWLGAFRILVKKRMSFGGSR